MISFKVGIWEVEKGYSYQILKAMEYVSLPRESISKLLCMPHQETKIPQKTRF